MKFNVEFSGKYRFPEKQIKEYECRNCDVQFRTDYDYAQVKCPHCERSDDVVDLNEKEE